MRYDDASQAGSMAADSAPTARPDVDFLPQGDMGPATGNAITGAGTTSGAAGADLVGDAPARTASLRLANGTVVTLASPVGSTGELAASLASRGEGPFAAVFVATGGEPQQLDPALAHGARLSIA